FAGSLPALLDVPQRGLGLLRLTYRHQAFGLSEQLLLHLQVLPVLGVDLSVLLIARLEEDVLRGPEARPQGVVLLTGGPARSLPFLHQLPVGERGGAPFGGV